VRDVGQHVVGERVLAEDDEENLAPAIVVVGNSIKGDGDQHLDVDDGLSLGVNRGVLSLESVEGGLAIRSSLGGGRRVLALALGLQALALRLSALNCVIVGHGKE
jgi:hypothetical protein